MQNLLGKKIIVGVSGGIAAYKSAELVRLLGKNGAEVRVVMTNSAKQFITPLTLQALSGNVVRSELLDEQAEAGMGHIELAKWADLLVIAPASANCMARINAGLADDLLSAVVLATKAPIFIVPAMNQAMWSNSATCNNVANLRNRGIQIIGPNSGEQACGDIGCGRMSEPLEIVNTLLNNSKKTINNNKTNNLLLLGKKVLITAGPTQESIDPVRYISNHSSGKMGFALAKACANSGADVVLVAGPTILPSPLNVKHIKVISADEMLAACLANVPCDIFIGAAAVADYKVDNINLHKIKKTLSSNESFILRLMRNTDILATITLDKKCKFAVGFAAETENLLQFAERKLAQKKLDLIIANDVSNPAIGFNSDENAVTIIDKSLKKTILPKASKDTIASQIVTLISEYYDKATN